LGAGAGAGGSFSAGFSSSDTPHCAAQSAHTTTHLYTGTLQVISFLTNSFLVRISPQVGGTIRLGWSAAQGSQHDLQPAPPSQPGSPQLQSHGSLHSRGRGGQCSVHLTSQTVFLTSFISHTTLQTFCGQCCPQTWHASDVGSQAFGATQASPAQTQPASSAPTAVVSRILFIFVLLGRHGWQGRCRLLIINRFVGYE